MVQFPSYKYNFFVLCYVFRLVQIVCVAANVFLVFMESGSLSYPRFFLYMSVCGMYLHHIGRRWTLDIDGRYDLRQLFRETQMTARVQYAIASLSASLLCLVMWNVVQLTNPYFRAGAYVCGLSSTIAAHSLLLTEFYEILFVPEK